MTVGGPDSRSALGPQLPLQMGRFTLAEELGAGGMATVYLGKMRLGAGLDRLVAVKTIHGHLAKKQSFVDMFLDEARIASMISHPNVCAVYDFGEEEGVYFLAMEHLLGDTLFDAIGAIDRDRGEELMQAVPFLAARIIADACEGIHAAHTAKASDGKPLGIVHRDVSPQNIFVTYEGAVKIVDFGCAKALERVTQTNTGIMKGKVSYAAPEQLRAEELDHRADIFALGVCLWEALALRPLFRRDTALETAKVVLEADAPRADEGRPWVPKALADIAAKALQRDREERYSSAREMGRDLRNWIARGGAPFESAEVAEWMDYLFAKRHAKRRKVVQQVEAIDASSIQPVSAVEEALAVGATVVGDDQPGTKAESHGGPAAPARPASAKATPPPLKKPAPAKRPPSLKKPADSVPQAPRPAEGDRRAASGGGRAGWVVLVVLLLAGGALGAWVFAEDQVRGLLGMPLGPQAAGDEAPPETDPHEVVDESDPYQGVDMVFEPEGVTVESLEDAPPPTEEEAPEGSTGTTPAPQPMEEATETRRRSARRRARRPTSAEEEAAAGALRIRATGGYARVVYQGNDLGRTPVRFDLPPGLHSVRVLPNGEEPGRTFQVRIEAGTLKTLNVQIPGDEARDPGTGAGTSGGRTGGDESTMTPATNGNVDWTPP